MKKIIIKYWHIIILVLFSLTPVVWFIKYPTSLVNGIDTNFPLNPLTWIYRRFFVWDALINAGFHFSSTIAGIFFHFVQVVPYVLGFSLHYVELFSFIFWFCATVFSSWFFARLILPNSKLTQVLLVCFYAFNTYLFNIWENVKVANLALAVALPLALSVLHLLKEKKINWKLGLLVSAGIGLLASGAGINPSYILSLFLASFLLTTGYAISETSFKTAISRFLDLFILFLGIFLVNLFWILPTAYYIISNVPASQSLQGIGITNWVDSLSQNTSIFNVMRLQGAWDWYPVDDSGMPYYIPYALKYFNNPIFLAFSVLIPLLAIISCAFVDKEKKGLYLGFIFMMLVGIFLGAGTHPPTGVLYRWLANNIPFFGIFRSPWYVFTSFLTLAYASLIALLFRNIEIKSKYFSRVVVAFLIIGNLFYNYPLVLGRIFRPGRSDGFYVQFPQYVFDSLDWVNKNETGRILGYPEDEIEQFEWGYRGVESILQLGSNKEVLYMPLYFVDTPVIKIINQLYSSIKKNQVGLVTNLLPKLGVQTLFYKGDQKSIRIDLPEIFKNYSAAQFGKWYFYDFSELNNLGKIFSASNYFMVYPFSKAEKSLGAISKNSIVINPEDSVSTGISEIYKNTGTILIAENSHKQEMDKFLLSGADVKTVVPVQDLSLVEFKFSVKKSGMYTPVLESYKLTDFGIKVNQDLQVTINNKSLVLEPLEVGDYVKYKPIFLEAGDVNMAVGLVLENLITEKNFQNNKTIKNQEIEIVEENENSYISLVNSSPEDLKVEYLAKNFDPLAKYFVSFDYKHVYGDRPKLVINQFNTSSPMKTQAESAPKFPEWKNYHTYFEPVPTKSDLRLTIQAEKTPFSMTTTQSGESTHSYGTKIFFDNLTVFKLFTNELMFISTGEDLAVSSNISYKKVNPVKYEGVVNDSGTSDSIVFLENYSPDWRIKFETLEGQEFKPKIAHFTGNLYSNVWFVKNVPKNYKFTIYYWPQSLLIIGVLGSVTSVLVLIYFQIREILKKNNK